MSNDLQNLFENIYFEMNLEVPHAIMTTLTMTLGLVSQRFSCSDKLFHPYFPLYFSSKFFLYIFLHNFLIFSPENRALVND